MKQYRPDIDGLRAIAILPVIFFHYGFGFSGGYVGVDVFFVISGNLITSLLLEDMQANRFSMMAFWERRIRRIFPAMALMALVCAVAAVILLLPYDLRKFGRSLAAQMYFWSNFHFWRNTGYFDAPAESMPLLHTWSLAVEEQFYLVFPALLFYLRRFQRPALLVSFLAVASFAVSIYCVRHFPSAAFYLPHSRAWELFLGALLAMLRSGKEFPKWICETFASLGAVGIAYAVFTYTANTPFPGVAAALPCAGAALLIWANESRQTWMGRFLSLKPLTWVGALSYSLYLWHWPVLVFSRYWVTEPLSVTTRLLLLAVTFLFSWLSWKFVETPFRKRQLLPERRRLFKFAAQASVALLVVGTLIHALKGLPQRFPKRVLELAATSAERHLPHANAILSLRAAQAEEFPVVGAAQKGAAAEFFVWGDSHAMALLPLLNSLGREYSVRGYFATYGSRIPALNFYRNADYDAVPFSKAVVATILKRGIENVFLAARWSNNCDVAHTAPLRQPFVGVEAQEAFERQMKITIEKLRGEKRKVWIVLDVPEQQFDPPMALAAAELFGRNPNTDVTGISGPLYYEQTAFMRGLVPKMKEWGALILDPATYLTNSAGSFPVIRNGKPLYRDTHHLSVQGAMELRGLFEPIFREMAAPSKTAAPENGAR